MGLDDATMGLGFEHREDFFDWSENRVDPG